MYGLIVLVGFIIYCLLCFGFVRLIASLPPKSQRRRRTVYGLVTFILFNTPLGYQFVPATVVGIHGCLTESGFELYKTPEQWVEENPLEARELKPYAKVRSETKHIIKGHNRRIFHLNSRFDWVIDYYRAAKNLYREEQTVVDIESGEIMARLIDFKQVGPAFLGAGSASGCFRKSDQERWIVDEDNFRGFKNRFKRIGERK